MPNRISKGMLEHQVNRLNDITGQPKEPYSLVDGKFTPNPGNYHLSWAYGGVCVDQMSEGGGTRTIISGFYPKRETFNKLVAYIDGVSSK